MLFAMIYMMSEVFQIYEAYLLMRCFFKECRVSRKVEFLMYVGLLVVKTVPYTFIGIPIVTLICSYGGTLLATMFYKGSFRKRILSGTLMFISIVMAECIVALFSGYVDMDIFESSEYNSIFGFICLPLVQFLVVLLVRNFKNISEGETVPTSYWIMSISLPLSSVVLYSIIYRQRDLEILDLFFSACILFIINIFVLYLYDRQIEAFRIKQEKETLQMQNQYQLNQLELMNQMVEQSRELRHDFLKHISMISYMNEQREEKRLAAYLEEIQGNIENRQRYADTGNFVLDGLLNYKIQEAMANGIRMEMDVVVPEDLELSVYDMNVILTNLLDNSIEAVRQSKDEEDKKIEVHISYSKKRLVIRVENPFDGVVRQEDGHFVTTKEEREAHGYGMKNVEQMVKKYDGLFEVKTAENAFIVEVCLFLE